MNTADARQNSNDTEVRPIDILLGKAKSRTANVGSIAFKALIEAKMPLYVSLGSSIRAKVQLTVEIVDSVYAAGSRFLVEIPTRSSVSGNGREKDAAISCDWCELDTKVARERVRCAFRDAIRAAKYPRPNSLLNKIGYSDLCLSGDCTFEEVYDKISGNAAALAYLAKWNQQKSKGVKKEYKPSKIVESKNDRFLHQDEERVMGSSAMIMTKKYSDGEEAPPTPTSSWRGDEWDPVRVTYDQRCRIQEEGRDVFDLNKKLQPSEQHVGEGTQRLDEDSSSLDQQRSRLRRHSFSGVYGTQSLSFSPLLHQFPSNQLEYDKDGLCPDTPMHHVNSRSALDICQQTQELLTSSMNMDVSRMPLQQQARQRGHDEYSIDRTVRFGLQEQYSNRDRRAARSSESANNSSAGREGGQRGRWLEQVINSFFLEEE